jgi:hypothetical protein
MPSAPRQQCIYGDESIEQLSGNIVRIQFQRWNQVKAQGTVSYQRVMGIGKRLETAKGLE